MPRELQFSDDHPALAGHFPGNPLVPGVVLLDRVMVEAGGHLAERDGGHWRITQAPAVKFMRPLRPGEAVTVSFDGSAEKLRFRATLTDDPDTIIATGTLAGIRE
ncbi:hypothetical protein H0Z60_21360 [Ectothiorhodospiraceae bacterium WFHF3C12]|nr:hypothetical protein [Ectothiorhodospiraceae bacterium WFHF3C12]